MQTLEGYDIIISVMKMLLMKDIMQEGEPVLHKRATEVKLPLSKTDLETIRGMMEYVHNSQNDALVQEFGLRPAVGLAAPQINVPLRMFVMSAYDEEGVTLYEYAVVNPKILSSSEEQTYLPGGEGCLSVDEAKNGLVPRANRIKVKFEKVNLETGETVETLVKLTGYVGIVFQHEFDHLNGILFVSKVKEALPNVKPIEFPDSEE